MLRKFPRAIKRVVVKVGSSVIATDTMKPRVGHLQSLVNQITDMQKKDMEVVLVSSGAIVFGMGKLNLLKRPSELSAIQALAAVGQTVLMEKYNELFSHNQAKCAQILLTWDDFDNRRRYNNVRNTIAALLGFGIVPIINENDTISTDEIKFGDNDRLSALVASLVEADLLVILSDVDGLYDLKSGDNKIFNEIKEITREIEGTASGTIKKEISKGGMSAKLEAIKIANHSKIPCIVANGETENVLLRILNGEGIGTFFVEREEKLLARQHWISFGAKPKGSLTVDEGAKKALLQGGRSLLLPGIVSWDGHFKVDDVVVVRDQAGHEIARGISNYSTADFFKVTDKKGRLEVIHCDNLVLGEK